MRRLIGLLVFGLFAACASEGSGALSGAPAGEGFSYFVLCAEDAEGAEACEMYGVRSGAPGTSGPLATRAEGYQQVRSAPAATTCCRTGSGATAATSARAGRPARGDA